MKTTTIKSLFGGIALASAIMAMPVAAFATNSEITSSVKINGDGIVHVLRAEVTSVSGSVINAVTRFRDNIMNWSFTTSAATKIVANNSSPASSSDIQAGDTISVTGMLASLGSTVQVNATKIKDVTSMPARTSLMGTVQSVNIANGTFVITTHNKKQTTVQTNTATVFSFGNSDDTSLESLALNSKVAVQGTVNSEGTFITATKVANKDGLKNSFRDWKGKWFKNHSKENKHL